MSTVASSLQPAPAAPRPALIPHARRGILIAVALLAWATAAAAQTPDSSLWVTNGQVNAIVRDGNTIYIGGSFTQVGPATGGGMPLSAASGSPAQAFPKVSGQVMTVVPDGAGGWFIGGAFSSVGGLERLNLAHVLADGQVADWAPNPNGAVYSIALAGSKLYACGPFTWIGMRWRTGIAAVDVSTGVATSWNPGVDGARVLTIATDTLYVGGDFTSFAGEHRDRIAAVSVADDALLPWGPIINSTVVALAASGNTLYVGGAFSNIGGQWRNGIAALHRHTGVVTSWNPGGGGPVNALAVSGGIVYAGGSFTAIGNEQRSYLAAVDSATGLATPWNPSPNGGVGTLAVHGGTVYVGGAFTIIANRMRNGLAALDSAGAATSWDPRPNAGAGVLAVSNGVVFAGGGFTMMGGLTRSNIAAIDALTGNPTAWDPSATGIVRSLAVRGGTVYAGGEFQAIGGQPWAFVAALETASGNATAWHPILDGSVNALVVTGTRVYAAGSFRFMNGVRRDFIGAVDATSGATLAWNPSAGGQVVHTLAMGEGVIYVGGQFSYIGNSTRYYIAALDTLTANATTWDPYANSTVYALVVSGNTVYAGGQFTSIGNQARHRVAALDATTGLATAWSPPVIDDAVRAIAIGGNTVYAGGTFNSVGGLARSRIVALDATSGAVTLWNPAADGPVLALALSGNTVYLGGGFQSIGGRPQPSLAAIQAGVQAPPAAPVFVGDVQVSATSIAVGQAVTITAIVRNDGAPSDDGRIVFSFKDLTDPSDAQRLTSGSAGDAPGYRVLPRGSTLMGRDCQPVTAQYLVAEYADADWPGLGAEKDTFSVTVRPRTAGVFSIDVRATMHTAGGGPCDDVSALPRYGQTSLTDQQGWTVRRFVVNVVGTPAAAEPHFLDPVDLSAQSLILGESLTITARVQDLGALSDDGRIVISFPALTDPLDGPRATSASTGDVPGFRVLPAGSSLLGAACQPVTGSYLVAEYADSSWQPIGYEADTFAVTVRPREVGTFTIYVRATMHTAGGAPCDYVSRLPSNGELVSGDQQGWPVMRFSVTVNPAPTASDPSFVGSVTVSADSITLGESFSIGAIVRNLGAASDDGRIVFGFPSFTDTADAGRVVSSSAGDDPGFRTFRAGSSLLDRSCQPRTSGYLVVEYVDNDWQWIGSESNGLTTVVTPRVAGDFVVDVRSTMHTAGAPPCDFVNDLPSGGQGGVTDQQGWAVTRFVVHVKPAPATAEPAFVGTVSVSSNAILAGGSVIIRADVRNLGLTSDDGRIVVAFPALTDPSDHSRVSVSPVADAPGTRRLPAGSPLLGRDCQPVNASYLVVEYADADWEWFGHETNTLQLTVWPRNVGDFWIEVRSTMHTAGGGACDYVNGLPPNGGAGGPDQQGWEVHRFLVTVSAAPPAPVFPSLVSMSSGIVDLGQTVKIIASVRNDAAGSDDGRVTFAFPALTSLADTQRVTPGRGDDTPGYRVLPAGSLLMGADCQPAVSGHMVVEYADNNWLGGGTETNVCTLTVRPRLPGTFEIQVRAPMHPTGADPCAMVNAVPPNGTAGTDAQGWPVRSFFVTVNAAPAAAKPTFDGSVVVSTDVMSFGETLTITATVRNDGAASDDGRIVLGFPALNEADDGQWVSSAAAGDVPGFRVIPSGAALARVDCQPMAAQYLVAEYADDAWDAIGDETTTLTVTVRPPREGLFAIEVRSTMRTAGAGSCAYVNTVPGNGQGGFVDQQGWTVRRFDVLVGSPSSMTWRQAGTTGPGPVARAAQAAVYDDVRDELVLYGGTALTYTGDSWSLPLAEGASWSPLQPGGPVPLVRIMHSMVFNPVENHLVIFGGLYDDPLNDLWILARTPTAWWFPISVPGVRPSPRLGHTAIYDPVRRRMLVIGGYGTSVLNDVWEYSPMVNGTWRQLAPEGTPMPARATHAAVYDPVRDRVLVFGGDGGVFLNDVWELRLGGAPAWSRITPLGAPPTPRRDHSLVYDAQWDELIVFGGFDGTRRLNDVWTLSLGGVPRWERRFSVSAPPSARNMHSAVYDEGRRRMVVFGGQVGATQYSSEVWELTIDAPTPVALSLAEAEAGPDAVHLAWYGEGAAQLRASVERSVAEDGSESGDEWLAIGDALPSGPDRLVFEDRDVTPGGRYGYRLRVWQDTGEELLGPVWVTVPARAVLALAGASPNPASDHLNVAFSLPAEGAGALELFDLRGRRVARHELAGLGPGPHRVVLADGRRLAAGVYLVRLTFAGQSLTTKACVVR